MVSFIADSRTTGVGGRYLVVGDFNGDGYSDIAIPSAGGDLLFILLNNGNGTFTLSSTIMSGGWQSMVNHDRRLQWRWIILTWQ